MFSIIVSENSHLEQMDVKKMFLHGDLDKEKKVLEITKQVGVEVELEKSNPEMSKQMLNQLVLKNLKWSMFHLSRF